MWNDSQPQGPDVLYNLSQTGSPCLRGGKIGMTVRLSGSVRQAEPASEDPTGAHVPFAIPRAMNFPSPMPRLPPMLRLRSSAEYHDIYCGIMK